LIETKRLLLRELREDDAPAYAQMCADPEVMRYVGGELLSADDAWRQLAMLVGHWTLRGFGMWAVEDRAGDFVGRVGLHFPLGWPERELGWALARKHWGQGYALEAAAAVRDHAFRDRQRPRLASFIHPENARSIRLAERLGGQPQGTADLRGHHVLVYVYTAAPGVENRHTRGCELS
jgi:RimJ/RimL family protein N-acetyltransferase